VSKDMGFFIF